MLFSFIWNESGLTFCQNQHKESFFKVFYGHRSSSLDPRPSSALHWTSPSSAMFIALCGTVYNSLNCLFVPMCYVFTYGKKHNWGPCCIFMQAKYKLYQRTPDELHISAELSVTDNIVVSTSNNGWAAKEKPRKTGLLKHAILELSQAKLQLVITVLILWVWLIPPMNPALGDDIVLSHGTEHNVPFQWHATC